MKKFECSIFCIISLSILFLSFSSSFAHVPPAQDSPPQTQSPTSSPPQSQSPPSSCPPCPPCPCPCPEDKQSPPSQENQGNSPPSQEQNSPPTQENQGNSPPSQENSPPSQEQSSPPTQENQGNSPPTQENQGNSPPSQGNSPPTQENQGNTPPSQEQSPTQENQENSPPTQENQGNSPPTQGNSPPTQENQGNAPPSQENQGNSPPTQGNSPPTQENQGNAPPSQENQSPPNQENQGTPPTGQTTETSTTGETNTSFKGSFTKIYAFGDSFTDTGNCVFLEGFKSFMGKIFSSTAYTSSAKLPGHRLSNGRLVIDFLCDDLGLPSLQAYKDTKADFSAGANFAVAGSTCLASDFFAKQKGFINPFWKAAPQSTLTQIDWFNNYITNVACKGKDEAQCKSQIEGSLFWIGALGFSDYARIFESAAFGQSPAEASVDHVSKFLKALLEKGAKFIVVQGLPPAGCCPLLMLLNKAKQVDNMGCSSVVNTMITAHNELLQKKLEEFRAQNKGSVIVYADTWKAYQAIFTNYKQYGFEEPTKACCGAGGGQFNFNMNSLCGAPGTVTCPTPQKYISWDGIHFTEAMNKQLAELMFTQKGYCNPSFEVLIQAKMSIKVA